MGRVVEKILEVLQTQAETTVALIDVVCSDRATSYRKARRLLYRGPPEFRQDWADWYRERQIFYTLLNNLKRQGLIVKKRSGVRSHWSITRIGKRRLAALQERRTADNYLPRRQYPKRKGGQLLIVAFDVPEKERKKRDWLRAHLLAFGLSPLQKSVWIGTIGLPQEFMKDLRMYKILPYVHIFSVNRRGTITVQSRS